MQKNTLKYSTLVFVGGASYGMMAAVVKLAYAEGFSWAQTVASQALFAVVIFAVVWVLRLAMGTRPARVSPRRFLALMGLGLNTCATGVLYNYALTMLPVSVAITLLFQFTWIGIVIQVIVTRRRPRSAEVTAAVIILGGTFMAGGLLSETTGPLHPLGVVCGLLSAVSCALFMFFSSRVGTDLPPIQRGLIVCLGSAALAFALCPDYFASGALQAGIWKYGLMLGLCALFVPVILFGIATPHLATGLSTIMAASELPCGIAMSMIIIGEPVAALQLVGVAVILAGVVVSQLPNLLPSSKVHAPG